MIGELAAGTRLLVWLLFVLAWPFLSIRLVRSVLDVESNIRTFGLLAAYTVLDALVALVLIGSSSVGIVGAVILIIGTILAGAWNYFAIAWINKFGK